MKKSLLALAVLGAFAGAASAQSSVTLYGTVDLSGKYVKNDGSTKRLSLARDGINSSQLGFRGVEDLGGGLKAGFDLIASVGADSGDIGAGQSATGSGKFFTRRSVIKLIGNFGEIRAGRDYTPTFWNDTIFDAFGTNGLGDSSHVGQVLSSTFVRADNSVEYYLPPNLGGFYGQGMAATGEGPQAGQGTNAGRYLGVRFGFAAGPFDVAAAYGTQRNGDAAGDSQKTYNIGGAYDFGFLKVMGYVDRDTVGILKDTRGSISVVVPFGQSEVHVGYSRSKATKDNTAVAPAASNGLTNTIWQAAATYQYNLSKRTALYGTVSTLSNGDFSRNSVAGGTSSNPSPASVVGPTSKGFELGMRHFF